MKALREFLEKHSRHIPAAAIVGGFIFDLLTLGRPDSRFAQIVLLLYLGVAAFVIILLAISRRRSKEEPIFLISLLQFCFGNLAGSLLVLYGMSGTIAGGTLFFSMLLFFIIRNEFLREKYARVRFHIEAWYFLLLLYCVFVFPIYKGYLGWEVFLKSVFLSLVLLAGFLLILFSISPQTLREHMKTIFRTSVGIAFAFSVLYFFNLIPPVPLSLQSIGIYHSVEKLPRGDYRVTFEPRRWFEPLRSTSGALHAKKGERAYCFSAVFATREFATPVVHHWEKVNGEGRWETLSKLNFSIRGGRDEGYRGYSRQSVSAGKYRCSVETISGSLVGRVGFRVFEEVPVTTDMTIL